MDIGKGDCVVAVRHVRVRHDAAPGGLLVLGPGTRATVDQVKVGQGGSSQCCGQDSFGLTLVEYPLEPLQAFCACSWRRKGPGIEDIRGMFAETLNSDGLDVALPVFVPEPVTAETVRAWNRVWDRWVKVGPL